MSPDTPVPVGKNRGGGQPAATLEQVVAQVLGADGAEVRGSTGPSTDARWTSLKHLQVVAAVNRAFGVQLSPRQVRAVRSVDDLRLVVEAH
ncbi:acyl carrier protein [uncultured Cellulomonas sp.]|uniref:acyl carrier protein n=1 Tax=uncultured Cellulomonas sp. TaxID=189682 RepID=UPI0028EF799C|nr:acyl carrier protein [uncultured Cellulomonas sp.]